MFFTLDEKAERQVTCFHIPLFFSLDCKISLKLLVKIVQLGWFLLCLKLWVKMDKCFYIFADWCLIFNLQLTHPPLLALLLAAFFVWGIYIWWIPPPHHLSSSSLSQFLYRPTSSHTEVVHPGTRQDAPPLLLQATTTNSNRILFLLPLYLIL